MHFTHQNGLGGLIQLRVVLPARWLDRLCLVCPWPVARNTQDCQSCENQLLLPTAVRAPH